MKFKDFVRERDVQRIIEIENFFNQPTDIIIETIELGKTKITEISSNEYSTKYFFKVDKEIYEVMFVKKIDKVYELSFSLEKGNEQFTRVSNKFQTFRVYSGLLDTIKMFVENHDPDEILMSVSIPKKSDHFLKVMKMVFKRYKNIFQEYKIVYMKENRIIDLITLNILTIKRK